MLLTKNPCQIYRDDQLAAIVAIEKHQSLQSTNEKKKRIIITTTVKSAADFTVK